MNGWMDGWIDGMNRHNIKSRHNYTNILGNTLPTKRNKFIVKLIRGHTVGQARHVF
jgi:hypothetical protein